MAKVSPLTESVYVELFEKISYSDSRTEQNRKILASNPDFTIEKAWNRLNQTGQYSINQLDISDFFNKNNRYLTSDEARQLEKRIAPKADGRISFNEFKEQISPQTDLYLRERLQTRVNYDRYLNQSSEKGLFDTLSEELNNTQSVNKVLNELKSRQDYVPYDLYRIVDELNLGYIDSYALSKFLNKNRKYLTTQDIEGILQRIGHHHTGKVTYSELVHVLTDVQMSHSYISLTPKTYTERSQSSSLQESQKKFEESRRELSQSLNKSSYESQKKFEESRRELTHSLNKSSSLPVRSISFVDTSPNNQSKRKLLQTDEKEYANTLIETLKCDSNIEELRKKLTNQLDFNLRDAWLIFNSINGVSIDAHNIKSGLEILHSYKNTYEIEPTIRRVSQGYSILNQSQFCNIISSRDAQYKDKLEKRLATQRPGQYSFSQETQIMFKDFMNTQIDNENRIMRNKDLLRSRYTFNNIEAWNTVNKQDLVRINVSDFRRILEDNQYHATTDELNRLMERYKQSDVNFNEFCNEIDNKQ